MIHYKHVVVGDVAEGLLSAAFHLDPENEYQGEICNFRDDLSIGRIDGLMEGHEKRTEWFSQITAGTAYGQDLKGFLEPAMEKDYHDLLTFHPKDRIVIWHSGIVSEEVTLRYLVSRFKAYDLWEVGGFSCPLGRCQPHQVLAALGRIRPFTEDERAMYQEEWSSLSASQARVRIFKDGSLYSVEESWYDQLLLDAAGPEYGPAAGVVGKVMAMTDQIVSDTFLDYRLRSLIRQGKLEAKGDFSALRFYQVCQRN